MHAPTNLKSFVMKGFFLFRPHPVIANVSEAISSDSLFVNFLKINNWLKKNTPMGGVFSCFLPDYEPEQVTLKALEPLMEFFAVVQGSLAPPVKSTVYPSVGLPLIVTVPI